MGIVRMGPPEDVISILTAYEKKFTMPNDVIACFHE